MTAVDSLAVPSVLIAEPDTWTRDLLKQMSYKVALDAKLEM